MRIVSTRHHNVSIRQHTSILIIVRVGRCVEHHSHSCVFTVAIRLRVRFVFFLQFMGDHISSVQVSASTSVQVSADASAYVSIRQHTSPYIMQQLYVVSTSEPKYNAGGLIRVTGGFTT